MLKNFREIKIIKESCGFLTCLFHAFHIIIHLQKYDTFIFTSCSGVKSGKRIF